MATTTNYGWTTPDDTALVKDGASAIRSLGTSVDTTTKNLNPSTTLGDIEYRSSTSNTNTRLGIGSSGQGLQVVAGVPSWAASSTSTLTTTGDLLYASAANTLARRGIGSTGQVLTVSGGVPTWASASSAAASYSLLNSGGTSLSGTSTTISGISGMSSLLILVEDASTDNSGTQIQIRINGDTANHLVYGFQIEPGSSYSSNILSNTSNSALIVGKMGLSSDATAVVSAAVNILGCNSTGVKTFMYSGGGNRGNASNTNQAGYTGGGTWTSTSTVSSIVIRTSNGSNFDAGKIYVYGSAV